MLVFIEREQQVVVRKKLYGTCSGMYLLKQRLSEAKLNSLAKDLKQVGARQVLRTNHGCNLPLRF